MSQVQVNCKTNISPKCHNNCTLKCNKKCLMRDNEGCLKSCALVCNMGCLQKASKMCVKRNRIIMKDCKKLCTLLPAPRKIKVAFDAKCGNRCTYFHSKTVALCSSRPFQCTFPCLKKCKTNTCTTRDCLSSCVEPCVKGCLWRERKNCHYKEEKKTRKCLKRCSGWSLRIELEMMQKLNSKHVGKIHRCKVGCRDQIGFDMEAFFNSRKEKCPSQCQGICQKSKCETAKCRVKCSKKCTNTCYGLVRKKCALLAREKAKQCLKDCK